MVAQRCTVEKARAFNSLQYPVKFGSAMAMISSHKNLIKLPFDVDHVTMVEQLYIAECSELRNLRQISNII